MFYYYASCQKYASFINSYGVATISRLSKTWVSFAKELYKRDYILLKRPVFLRSLLTIATPDTYVTNTSHMYESSTI